VLKSVFESSKNFPILVWENEGGACDRRNVVSGTLALSNSKRIDSQEAFYFHNLTKELETSLGDKTLTRPDASDGSECPEVEWVGHHGRKVHDVGK
jgi:hypothetical protein